VIIAEVKQDSPAQAAGLQPGDVLEMVGSHAITNPQQAVTALRSGTQKSGAVALRVLRGRPPGLRCAQRLVVRRGLIKAC
jgi:serine protease Do